MTPGRQKQWQEIKRARWEAGAPDRALASEACRIIAAWNKHACKPKPLQYYPTVGAALRGNAPICDYYCWACRQVGFIDIRKQGVREGDALSVLIPLIRCGCAHGTTITLVHLRAEGSAQERWLRELDMGGSNG